MIVNDLVTCLMHQLKQHDCKIETFRENFDNDPTDTKTDEYDNLIEQRRLMEDIIKQFLFDLFYR